MDHFGLHRHLVIINLEHSCHIRASLPQDPVSLHKCPVVSHVSFEVDRVILAYNHIQEAAPLLTAPCYQGTVSG